MTNKQKLEAMTVKSYRSKHHIIFIGLLLWSLVAMPPLAIWIFIGWIINCLEVGRANKKIRQENQLASQAQSLHNIEQLLAKQQENQQSQQQTPMIIKKW